MSEVQIDLCEISTMSDTYDYSEESDDAWPQCAARAHARGFGKSPFTSYDSPPIDYDGLWENDSSFNNDSSVESSPYEVSKLEKHLYYHGIRGTDRLGPKLLFRTSKDIFKAPSGPAERARLMQLLPGGGHQQLAKDDLWSIICPKVVKLLDQRKIKLSSVDLVRFSWVEFNEADENGGDEEDGVNEEDDEDNENEEDNLSEDIQDIDLDAVPHGTVVITPVTIWIGVLPDTLTGEEAFYSSTDILDLLKEYGILDVDVAYRESVHLAFLSLVSRHSTWRERSAFTSKQAISFTPLRPVTICSPDEEGNALYSYNSGPKKQVVLLGNLALTVFLESILEHIHTLQITVKALEMTIKHSTTKSQGGDSDAQDAVIELAEYQALLIRTQTAITEVKAFQKKVDKQWAKVNDRVIGHVVWAPPTSTSTAPDDFSCDVCVIELDKEKFSQNFKGNVIDLGYETNRLDFTTLMFSLRDAPLDFVYPKDRLFKLRGILSEDEVREPIYKDNGCRIQRYVIKCGLAPRTTIGCLNGIKSYTRRYSVLGHRDSMEVSILSRTNKEKSSAFSRKGDSGSIIADSKGKFVALLTGGANEEPNDFSDVTYGTPMYWLWNHVIKAQFPGASLYFDANN